jgi:hypothetical protein
MEFVTSSEFFIIFVCMAVLALPVLLACVGFMFWIRQDILTNLKADDGIIVRDGVPRKRMLEKKAPRAIDDATAFAIEKEQAQRNARDYR